MGRVFRFCGQQFLVSYCLQVLGGCFGFAALRYAALNMTGELSAGYFSIRKQERWRRPWKSKGVVGPVMSFTTVAGMESRSIWKPR